MAVTPAMLTSLPSTCSAWIRTTRPQLNDKDENASYAGWNREIIAPADGTVVYVRNDVPNNTSSSGPDQKMLDSQHDPVFAVAGNCVILDHGNSEFSVMMHMREGSVMVKAGDHVKKGQLIGSRKFRRLVRTAPALSTAIRPGFISRSVDSVHVPEPKSFAFVPRGLLSPEIIRLYVVAP